MSDSVRRLLAVALVGVALILGGPFLFDDEGAVSAIQIGFFLLFACAITGAVLLLIGSGRQR